MSQTPRTDELSRIVQNQSWGFQEMKQLSAKLERENARLRDACQHALRVFQGWVHDIDPHNELSRTENIDLAAAYQMCETMSAALKPHSPQS